MNASVAILIWLGVNGANGQAFSAETQTRASRVAIVPPVSSQQPPSGPTSDGGKYPSSDAAMLLHDAMITLQSRQSVTARIRLKVNLFDQELLGSGYYRQQRGPNCLLFRLELKIQAKAPREPSSLLSVCDGRYLWSWRQLGGEEVLERIDMARAVRNLEEVGKIDLLRRQGGVVGIGGLPRLLRQLQVAFRFDQLDEVRLGDRMAAWRICGRWKGTGTAGESAAGSQPAGAERSSGRDAFPPQLPGVVVIQFGREDLFPYRIEFRRPDSKTGQRSGQGRGTPAGKPMVTADLFEVNLNLPIKPTTFVYRPGDLEPIDRTDDFLKGLGGE